MKSPQTTKEERSKCCGANKISPVSSIPKRGDQSESWIFTSPHKNYFCGKCYEVFIPAEQGEECKHKSPAYNPDEGYFYCKDCKKTSRDNFCYTDCCAKEKCLKGSDIHCEHCHNEKTCKTLNCNDCAKEYTNDKDCGKKHCGYFYENHCLHGFTKPNCLCWQPVIPPIIVKEDREHLCGDWEKEFDEKMDYCFPEIDTDTYYHDFKEEKEDIKSFISRILSAHIAKVREEVEKIPRKNHKRADVINEILALPILTKKEK